jgi:hypothetical protein
MPSTKPVADYEFLSLLSGRFDEPQSNKVMLTGVCLVFSFVVPLFFAWVITQVKIPWRQWGPDEWTVAALLPISMILGVWTYFYIGGVYEFSGGAVTLRRRGIVVGQIHLADIVRVEYSEDHHGHRWFTLHSDRQKMIVMLFPELKAAVERGKAQVDLWTKEMASTSAPRGNR